MKTDPHASIKSLLCAWGRWAIKRASSGIGYPSCSPMFKDSPSGDAYGSQIPLGVGYSAHSDFATLDADINKLPTVQRVTLIEVYQRGGSMREVAIRMGVKRDALGHWLCRSYEMLTIVIDNRNTGGHNQAQLDRMSHRLTR